MNRSNLLAAVLVASLLASCAPPALGTTGTNPFPAVGGAAKLVGGQTVYVRVDHSLAELGMEPGDIRPAMWVPSGYDSEVGDMTTQFALRPDRVPEGWTFRLNTVRVERSSERGSGAAGASRTVYAVWAVYEVAAPEGAIPGPYRLRGSLVARSAGEVPVDFMVEVTR